VPDPRTPSVAIVGAAGFVGRRLLRTLEHAGIPALAVVRHAPELSIDGSFHTALRIDRAEAMRHAPKSAIVVNLAYPASGSPVTYSAQNDEIAATVDRLLAPGGRVIHASTQAVFGLSLERPIHVGPAPSVRDDPYVEAKIETETRFARRFRTLDIVRLGNVWGPASGSWAVPIVHRLVTGRPVAVRGQTGFSNVTDVDNVASYFVHLLQRERSEGVQFHHLAELSATPWTFFVDGVARELGVEPVAADPDALPESAGLSDEFQRVLGPLKPRRLYKALASERTAGSWIRTLMRALPAGAFARLRGDALVFAAPAALDKAERTFLAVMSAAQQFQSQIVPEWTPPISETASLQRAIDWLRAG
jgi:nucleoside-diphosphate-sugar epimerase